jgi:AhpD family alkylhydroperoxidase
MLVGATARTKGVGVSKIPPYLGDPSDPTMQAVFAFADEHGAPGPDMARVLGSCPAGATVVQAWTRTHFGGTLPHRLKELVRIRMSVADSCGYCSSIQTERSKGDGVSDELLMEMMEDAQACDRLDDREKAAIRYADRFFADRLDADSFDDVSSHFTNDEMIELGLLCALILGMGRFARSLEVLTWEQACRVKPDLAVMNERLAATAPAT